ncbi:transcription factor MafB-like [Montipora capricornis]|uniref:transcription factor MafB-like n=1 Tax=Montipora capricornis TaxID=246305 RepID=UPI0035F21065
MDDNFLSEHIFHDMNAADSPSWWGENSLFDDVLTSDWNNDVNDLFNGKEKDDEGFEEEEQEQEQDEDEEEEEEEEEAISDSGIPLAIEHFSDEDIKNLRVRELNKLLRGLSQDEATKIRRKRRNLKNRDYAWTCRQRRLQIKEDLFNENNSLKKQLTDLTEILQRAITEKNAYKRKFFKIQSACEQAGLVLESRLVFPQPSLTSSE